MEYCLSEGQGLATALGAFVRAFAVHGHELPLVGIRVQRELEDVILAGYRALTLRL